MSAVFALFFESDLTKFVHEKSEQKDGGHIFYSYQLCFHIALEN